MGRYIPARSAFVNDTGEREHYDFGHYRMMLYEDLKGKHTAWANAINTRYRKSSGLNDLPNLSVDDLSLTSGYRDPHHNDYHAGATARHGLHQYGLALDVRGRDVDGIEGNDPEEMEEAAELAGARYTDIYPDTRHVHADWCPSGWPPSGPGSAPTFSLPAQSTDSASTTQLTIPPTTHPTNPTTPDPDPPSVLCGNSNRGAGACSYGRVASSASAHQTTCLAGHTYWSCNASEVTAHAGHRAPVLCGNSNRGAGACSSGRVVSSASAHQTTCLAGHTYWSCNTSAVSVHASHTAPVPVPVPVRPARAKCRARSWTGCEGWAGDHDAVCPAGHSYYTCNASAVAAHSRH